MHREPHVNPMSVPLTRTHPCHAVHLAGSTCTMNPIVCAFDLHAPVAAKVGSDTICNAPESKRTRFTLHDK
jgi:hypothetical protein